MPEDRVWKASLQTRHAFQIDQFSVRVWRVHQFFLGLTRPWATAAEYVGGDGARAGDRGEGRVLHDRGWSRVARADPARGLRVRATFARPWTRVATTLLVPETTTPLFERIAIKATRSHLTAAHAPFMNNW